MASELSEFRQHVVDAKSEQEFQTVLNAAPKSVKTDITVDGMFLTPVATNVASMQKRFRDDDLTWESMRTDLITLIDGRLLLENSVASGNIKNPKSEAIDILNSPVYVDRGDAKDRNWLGGVGDRIWGKIAAWWESLFKNQKSPNMPNISFLNGLGGLRYVFWILIGGGIALVIYFLVRNAKFTARKKRVGGILYEDEQERTADEWIIMAESLAGEEKYREAVRCLYLACLVKYDDASIARFCRHETNWEHLYRIESSPRNPQRDFRSLTQRFDKVWYGNIVRGADDYVEFRDYYLNLLEALKIKVPA